MRKFSMTLAIAAIITIFMGTDVALAGRIANRQIQQQKRIHQGIKSGELTRCEVRRLEREQRRIQQHKKRAWADGELNPKERVRLEHEQDRSSRHIYRMKHNQIQRPGD